MKCGTSHVPQDESCHHEVHISGFVLYRYQYLYTVIADINSSAIYTVSTVSWSFSYIVFSWVLFLDVSPPSKH